MDRTSLDNPGIRNTIIGAGFVFLSAVGFSAKAVMVKLSYRYHVDPLTLLTLRMVFSTPFFAVMAFWGELRSSERISRKDAGAILALGLTGFYLSAYLDFLGLQYISAGLERLVLFLYPTMVVLLSSILFGRKITKGNVVALALSYLGIALAFSHETGSHGSNVGKGVVLVIGSTFAYSMYLVIGGEVIRRVGASRFTGYVMLVACIALTGHFCVANSIGSLLLPAPVYGLALLMSVVATVFPCFMIAEGIRRIGASRAAIIGSVGPVATIFLAHVFLGEGISASQLAGTGFIIAGVLLVSLEKEAAHPSPTGNEAPRGYAGAVDQ